jgi:hypothetical protein
MAMITFPSTHIRRFLFFATSLLLSFSLETGHPEALSADSPGIRMLEEIQTVITELAEETKHSVVNLFPITGGGRFREGPGERMPNASGSGSGVIVDGEGHITPFVAYSAITTLCCLDSPFP